MDVHYLPPNRHFKSAKEYILDFLIVFLAVSLGFIGNDYRISYGKKAQSKEYAQSLYDDLKVDSVAIHRIYNEKGWIEAKFDSAKNILATKNLWEYNEFIYYVERYLSKSSIFISQDISFQQLPVTGNFLFNKDIKFRKQLAIYYTLCNQYLTIEKKFENPEKNDLNEIESALFNPRDLTSLDNNNSTDFYTMALRPTIKLKPIKLNVNNLKLLYIKVDNSKKHMNATRLLLERIQVYGTKIMKDLKKEYNLK